MFVRFSTVAGSRGSTDLARDVHGFATRFYTDEGNFGKLSPGYRTLSQTLTRQISWETTSPCSSSRMPSSSLT